MENNNFNNEIKKCFEEKISVLRLHKKTYNIYQEDTTEDFYSISNHACIGLKKILFHLKNFENFTLDCGGSTFVLNDLIIPFVFDKCENIVLKNAVIHTKNALNFQGKVVNITQEYCDIKSPYFKNTVLKNNHLYACINEEMALIFNTLEFENITNEICEKSGDQCFLKNFDDLKKEFIQKDVLRIYNPLHFPKLNNNIVFMMGKRYVTGIFIKNCKNVRIENVLFDNGIGMGMIAQKSENIFLDGFCTYPDKDSCFSLNADAVHIVNCKGQVELSKCRFENQLDDALNIHGIYTVVNKIHKDGITAKFMNDESKVNDIFSKGDIIAFSSAEDLLPKNKKILKSAEALSESTVKLVFEDDDFANIQQGDVIEIISDNADLYMHDCIVKNNRARGILIATSGKTIISHNYFHTAGAAINLSADGKFWFESGAVHDLTIKNNVFENCKYGNWENAVIDVPFSYKMKEHEYFHKNIYVENNIFISQNEMIADIKNVKNLCFRNNEGIKKEQTSFEHIGNLFVD